MKNKAISFQKIVAVLGILLFFSKLYAWKLTASDAVFSDAMESIVNIISAFLGLYSLYLSEKPRDYDHPYGHGKVAFVTASIEGMLIAVAGVLIIYEAMTSLVVGATLRKLDWGIFIIALTAFANYFIGYISCKIGEKENSLVLISSGKHLQSDTISSVGVLVSLCLVYFTNWHWLDAVIALFFGSYIIVVGYKIIRKALKGIMDENDEALLKEIVEKLVANRKPHWVDIHNMKVQQFGKHLHIDAHITLPYYYSLEEAHAEMEKVMQLLAENTSRSIEFNFHMDDCKPFSCQICSLNCQFRRLDFAQKIEWNEKSITQFEKHRLS